MHSLICFDGNVIIVSIFGGIIPGSLILGVDLIEDLLPEFLETNLKVSYSSFLFSPLVGTTFSS